MELTISKRKRQIVLLSPLIIILAGFLTATIFSRFMQEWAWIPLAIVYWAIIGLCIFFGKGDKRARD